jgi:hypothetical protein
MNEDLEKLAERLYNECRTIKPTWGQLGDVTKSYWMERASVFVPVPAEPAYSVKRTKKK